MFVVELKKNFKPAMPVPERHQFNIMFTFFRPGVSLLRSKAGLREDTAERFEIHV